MVIRISTDMAKRLIKKFGMGQSLPQDERQECSLLPYGSKIKRIGRNYVFIGYHYNGDDVKQALVDIWF